MYKIRNYADMQIIKCKKRMKKLHGRILMLLKLRKLAIIFTPYYDSRSSKMTTYLCAKQI